MVPFARAVFVVCLSDGICNFRTDQYPIETLLPQCACTPFLYFRSAGNFRSPGAYNECLAAPHCPARAPPIAPRRAARPRAAGAGADGIARCVAARGNPAEIACFARRDGRNRAFWAPRRLELPVLRRLRVTERAIPAGNFSHVTQRPKPAGRRAAGGGGVRAARRTFRSIRAPSIAQRAEAAGPLFFASPVGAAARLAADRSAAPRGWPLCRVVWRRMRAAASGTDGIARCVAARGNPAGIACFARRDGRNRAFWAPRRLELPVLRRLRVTERAIPAGNFSHVTQRQKAAGRRAAGEGRRTGTTGGAC